MKTSSIEVEASQTTTQSDSIVRQMNKRSSFLSYTTMNNKHIFHDNYFVSKVTNAQFRCQIGIANLSVHCFVSCSLPRSYHFLVCFMTEHNMVKAFLFV